MTQTDLIEGIPRLIHQMVAVAGPPRGHARKVATVYAEYVDKFTLDLAARAFIPIRDIAMLPMTYDHAPLAIDKPKFPQGYPVIGVHFNDTLVGICGISFQGTECTMTSAEASTNKFMLKPKPKYLQVD